MTRAPAGTNGFDAFRSSSYFNALDGLRAVAILMVLAHHVPRYAAGHPLLTLQENGRYGVAFFFVISGFLICTLFLREEDKNGRIDFGKFYGRRAVRLLPLYYATLFLQALLVFGFHHHSPENQALFREKLPSYALYFSNWLPTATQGPFFCAWSLAVEEQFYLVFGLLLFLASRKVIIATVIGAWLIKALAYNLIGNVDTVSTFWRVLFSYQEPILIGVLLAFALNERRWYELSMKWLQPAWVPAALAIAIVLMIATHSTRTQSTWDAQLLYLLMAATVASLVIRPQTPAIGSPFMVHVGKISYGIYLLHMFVLGSIKPFFPTSPAQCFLVTSTIVILLATLVYFGFEQPIIRHFKTRLSPFPQPNRSAAPSTNLTPISPIRTTEAS